MKGKIEMKKTIKINTGITLIALIITIIVLLILAGVAIAMLTGENGILTKANESKTETIKAEKEEKRRLTIAEANMNLTETEHKEIINGIETIVKIPINTAVSQVEGENTLNKGLVIIDKNGNEWVWVEVPKDIFKTATSGTDYIKIEADMKTYTEDYRKQSANQAYNWIDEWYPELRNNKRRI